MKQQRKAVIELLQKMKKDKPTGTCACCLLHPQELMLRNMILGSEAEGQMVIEDADEQGVPA